jgi:carbonic anhydrase
MDIIYRYDPYRPILPRQLENAAAAILALEQGHSRFSTILAQFRKELVGDHTTHQVIIPSDPLSIAFTSIGNAPPLQTPFALVLGCSDARVPIEQIFDQSPNDLFVIRVAGNVLGVECLGSIDYAVNVLGKSLKLLVVLGHTTCGAVSAAVDSYLAPKDYAEIAFTHALRSLVDRINVAVRGAATSIERVCGQAIVHHPHYRSALVEVAVYLNAAVTAFDVNRELKPSRAGSPAVVYGVFDLVAQVVRSRPSVPSAEPGQDVPIFSPVPRTPDDFADLGVLLAEAAAERWLRASVAPLPLTK